MQQIERNPMPAMAAMKYACHEDIIQSSYNHHFKVFAALTIGYFPYPQNKPISFSRQLRCLLYPGWVQRAGYIPDNLV